MSLLRERERDLEWSGNLDYPCSDKGGPTCIHKKTLDLCFGLDTGGGSAVDTFPKKLTWTRGNVCGGTYMYVWGSGVFCWRDTGLCSTCLECRFTWLWRPSSSHNEKSITSTLQTFHTLQGIFVGVGKANMFWGVRRLGLGSLWWHKAVFCLECWFGLVWLASILCHSEVLWMWRTVFWGGCGG